MVFLILDQEELLLFVLPAVQSTLDVWRQEKYWRRQRAIEFVASMKQKIDAALVPAPPVTPAPESKSPPSPPPKPIISIKPQLRRPRV